MNNVIQFPSREKKEPLENLSTYIKTMMLNQNPYKWYHMCRKKGMDAVGVDKGCRCEFCGASEGGDAA